MWPERAMGCAFAGASGMCLGGGMRRWQEPIEAAQISHPSAEPGQRAEQNKEQRTTARRPHSSQQSRDHHDTHIHLAQCTACDDSFSLGRRRGSASSPGPFLAYTSTGLHAGRGISKQSKRRSKQAAPPSHLVRLRHLDFSGRRSLMPGPNLP